MTTDSTGAFPFNRELAGSLADKIDGCPFSTIKRYFRDSTSEIEFVIIVQEGYTLESVGAYYVEPPANEREAITILMRMLQSGVIKYGVDDMKPVSPNTREATILLDSVADDTNCHALYFPPFYIVKLADKKEAGRNKSGGE